MCSYHRSQNLIRVFSGLRTEAAAVFYPLLPHTRDPCVKVPIDVNRLDFIHKIFLHPIDLILSLLPYFIRPISCSAAVE